MTRRLRPLAAVFAAVTAAAAVAAVPGCQGTGDLCVLGYTTKPPFDEDIRSVYIPLFKTAAFHTSPFRGIEADITQEIVTELGRRRSPIRVVSDPSRADTELIGTVTRINKAIYNRNLINLNREYEVQITVEVLWRDLRTGRVLSGRREPPASANPAPFDPCLPPAPPAPAEQAVTPVPLMGVGRVLPELGESTTTGQQTALRNLAVQIVNMMESPW